MKKVIGVGVVVIAISGILFVGYNNMRHREENFKEGLGKVSKLMPPYINHENTVTKGLFSSTGIYKLNYVEAGKTDSLIINYTVKHGVLSWFGGDMDFHSTLKLEGEMAKNIEASPTDSMVMDGVIKSDNSFDLKGKGSKVTINSDKDSGKIILQESTSSFIYDKNSGEAKMQLDYPMINLISDKMKVDIKNSKITRNFNINEPALGDFSFKIEEVANKVFNIKGLDIYAKALIQNNKLDVVTSLKAANVTALPLGQKDVALELTYSIKNVDKSVLQIYKEVSSQEGAEISSAQKEKILARSKEIVKTGGILSLDKLSIKNTKGAVEVSGAMELKPSASVAEISFAKNTKMNFNLLLKGDYAKMASLMPPQSQELFMASEDSIKSALLFDNGMFSVNDNPLPSEYSNQINIKLQELDNKFQQLK